MRCRRAVTLLIVRHSCKHKMSTEELPCITVSCMKQMKLLAVYSEKEQTRALKIAVA